MSPSANRDRIKPTGADGVVAIDGRRLHYLEYGSGPRLLVMVPGITSPAISWEFVALPLSCSFRVIVLDVRGRGLSAPAGPGGYSLGDYAADLAGFIRALALGRAAVLGHSMGARIVAATAASDPDVVGSTIIADPPLSGIGRDPYPFPLDVYLNALHEAQAGATAEDMRRYYATWPERELQIRADWLNTCDERAVVETYCNFHLEDFFDYWPRVPAPTLFIRGAESPVVTARLLADVVAANPAAEIASIEHAGHMIPFENLDGFLMAVEAFLGSDTAWPR